GGHVVGKGGGDGHRQSIAPESRRRYRSNNEPAAQPIRRQRTSLTVPRDHPVPRRPPAPDQPAESFRADPRRRIVRSEAPWTIELIAVAWLALRPRWQESGREQGPAAGRWRARRDSNPRPMASEATTLSG